MYTPLTIANTVVSLMPGKTPMWLNKIVYVIHGWSLAHDRPVVGEMPQVWRYGPIYASLYSALRHFGHVAVQAPQPIAGGCAISTVPEGDAETYDMIRAVLDRYGHFSDLQLSSIAHAEGTPWKLEAAAHNFRVPVGHTLPEWRLRDHCKRILAQHDRLAA